VGILRSFNTYPERANDPELKNAYEKLLVQEVGRMQ
jgi:hypothetical protein